MQMVDFGENSTASAFFQGLDPIWRGTPSTTFVRTIYGESRKLLTLGEGEVRFLIGLSYMYDLKYMDFFVFLFCASSTLDLIITNVGHGKPDTTTLDNRHVL